MFCQCVLKHASRMFCTKQDTTDCYLFPLPLLMSCGCCCAMCVLYRPGLPIDNMCTSFSAMGSAAIMPLDPEKGYEFEVAIFGGGTQVC